MVFSFLTKIKYACALVLNYLTLSNIVSCYLCLFELIGQFLQMNSSIYSKLHVKTYVLQVLDVLNNFKLFKTIIKSVKTYTTIDSEKYLLSILNVEPDAIKCSYV